MIAAVIRVALWLAACHAMAGAAAVGFLYTPDSNVLMLALSTLLVVACAVIVLFASTAAAHALVHGQAPWRSAGPAARLVPLTLVVALIVGALCAGADAFGTWWVSRAGEIDASAIAAGDVTDTRLLHAALRWIVAVIQWMIVPAWLATALAWAASYDRRDVVGLKWLVAGLHWRVLLVVATGVVVLVWAPWRFVYWRPRGLPSSSVEIAFVALKVGSVFLLAQLAWALALWSAATRVTPAAQRHPAV